MYLIAVAFGSVIEYGTVGLVDQYPRASVRGKRVGEQCLPA